MPLLEMADFAEFLLADERRWWTFVSALYFLIAIYAGTTPRRDYPAWFWMTYLLVSGSILLRIAAPYHFSEGPILVIVEYLLLVAAVVLGIMFFYSVSKTLELKENNNSRDGKR